MRFAAGRAGGQGGRAAAQCVNKLKQMALASHNFASSLGTLPPGDGPTVSPFPGYGSTYYKATAQVHILSYLEETNKYNVFNINIDMLAPPNTTGQTILVGTYQCPSDFTGDGSGGGPRSGARAIIS